MPPPERLCPECRRPLPPEAGARCPEHGLYGLDADALGDLETHPLLGQLLDEKYALLAVLGRGGAGSVYRALQEPLGRPVGVKLLHSSFLAVRDGRERFEREARALASLTSLHTVRLLDYGITRQGPLALRNIAYLVMELLEGEDLQSRLDRGPMAPVDVLELLDALADSLDEAHAAGIVHRDLKPANIVLTRRRDGREVAKLIDFGIARIEGSSHTEQGRVSGTPLYMAPEQARGDDTQGAAADVYAAGALCYELLTGRLPFSGPSASAVMMAHCQDDVPPMTTGTEPAGSVDLARVEPVIRLALSKEPADRPASVGALRDAFSRALGILGPNPTLPQAEAPIPEVSETPTAFDPEPPVFEMETAVAFEPAAGPERAPTPEAPPPGRVSGGVPARLLLGGAVVLALVAVVALATRRRPDPAPVAFGVAEPGGPAKGTLAPSEVHAASLAEPPPAPATAAEQPAARASDASPATAASRPRPAPKPAPALAANGSARLTLREDARQRVAVPAGRWRVVAEVDGEGDPLVFAWEAGACRGKGKPGAKRYDETCDLGTPRGLVVHNPITLFGSTTGVRIVWTAVR